MMLDRFGGGREPLGDLAVVQPFCQQQEDLELAWGEAIGVGLGRAHGSSGKATSARLSQFPPRDVGGGSGSEALEDGQGVALGGLIAVEEGQRLLVRATKLLPGVRR